ncbi:HORMA domain-containing protein 1 [Coemansia biformis]|uniref:HORMA domain-containing protein 1 n=1 Tax=Coemansia biformis TaxID=1286918 RepID=A0A9W8CZ76_9FUNG|nr:HORMA domain-containing protein 1 [Coemansia biformis]
MSAAAKLYISDVLYIAVSEIAYYRYLLPASFFDIDWFEGIEVHRIRAGKSVESDELLEILRGACECLSKDYLRSLAFGLSVHPDDPMYIRELYAFQLEATAEGAGNRSDRAKISAPVHVSSRLVLAPGAPAGYVPPSFLPLAPGRAGCYTIMPQFGSAQVGTMATAGSAVHLCVLSVEGPVQKPPLGSAMSAAPVQMSIDDDPQARVFAAAPSVARNPGRPGAIWARQLKQLLYDARGPPEPGASASLAKEAIAGTGGNSRRQPKRSCREQPPESTLPADTQDCECRIGSDEETCHARCYELGNEDPQPLVVCVTCQLAAAGESQLATTTGRLVVARRVATALCALGKGHVFSMLRGIGCSGYRGRAAIGALQALGLVRVDKSVFPHGFSVAPEARRTARATLFSDDIHAALAAAGHGSPQGSVASAGHSAPAACRPAA